MCTMDGPRCFRRPKELMLLVHFPFRPPSSRLYLEAEILRERKDVEISHRRNRSLALQ